MKTERLNLRQLTADDLDNLVSLDSDPEVMRYLNGGHPTPLAEIRDSALPRILAYYDRGTDYGYWAVEAAGEFLGWAFFRPHRGDGPPVDVDRSGIEIGYRLKRSAWGKGYATEACRALIAHGFDVVSVDRVFAETMVINAGSRRVMEKSGLRHVATFFPDWPDPVPGDEHGEVQYALTAAEWATTT